MKIKETREAIGLSKAEIAKRIGISTDKYAQIEEGKVEPTTNQLVTLADIFGVSIDYLLEHGTPVSQGEKTWLNIRNSLPEDKLRMVAQMLNGVDDLKLNDNDIDNICNVDDDRLDTCDSNERLKRLFKSEQDDDELTFEDYLVLKKIAEGEKISFMSEDVDTLKTNYSFTYEGRVYTKAQVSKILFRLDKKFKLLGCYFLVNETKTGFKCSEENYFSLNRKGKAALKAKEAELKEK